jgi:hypothetical protein
MSDTPETDHLEVQLGQAAMHSHPVIWKHARQLERERDEAREEAHRFRSLHYSHLGINASASWFPWEGKLGHE